MRIIGMDIHRVAAEAVVLHERAFTKLGRIPMFREALEEFAKKELTHDDHVVVEATGNAAAVVELRAPHVDRVYASGFLHEVWVPDPKTLALRRQVARRTQLEGNFPAASRRAMCAKLYGRP